MYEVMTRAYAVIKRGMKAFSPFAVPFLPLRTSHYALLFKRRRLKLWVNQRQELFLLHF